MGGAIERAPPNEKECSLSIAPPNRITADLNFKSFFITLLKCAKGM